MCFQEKDINLSGEHVREGLTCIVSVKIPNPEFEGQTKVLEPIMIVSLISVNKKHLFLSHVCNFTPTNCNLSPNLHFSLQTRLGNPEVRKIVDQSVQEYLTEYLELHPDVLDNIVSKSLNAYKVCFFCYLLTFN